LDLTTGEAPDSQVTAAIAAASTRLDQWTDDHFEPENALTLDLDGRGRPKLFLPKRIRALTSISFKLSDATFLAQTYTPAYEMISSVAGSAVDISGMDYIEIVPGQIMGNGLSVWPQGPKRVRIVGDFSWPSTPDRIKEAVAVLVWFRFKRSFEDREADQVAMPDGRVFQLRRSEPSGISEVDRIVADYSRAGALAI